MKDHAQTFLENLEGLPLPSKGFGQHAFATRLFQECGPSVLPRHQVMIHTGRERSALGSDKPLSLKLK